MRISDWSSDVCSSDLSGTVPSAWRADNTGNRIFAHPVADWLLDNRQFSDCRTYCCRRYDHILVVHPPPQHSREIGTATHAALTANIGDRGPISVDSREATEHRPASGAVQDPRSRISSRQSPEPRSEERRVGNECVSTCSNR